MKGLAQDGTAEPVSRAQILSGFIVSLLYVMSTNTPPVASCGGPVPELKGREGGAKNRNKFLKTLKVADTMRKNEKTGETCVCVCVCVFFPFILDIVRWTYQPGSHRKVTQYFSSTLFLRCVP